MSEQTSELASTGITFVGIRTSNLDAMKRFAEDVLGYTQKHEADGFAAFVSPQGQRLEFFDLAYPGHEHFTTGPVPGFEVQDFDKAIAWLRDNNYEILGEIITSRSGTRWVHFRGPDGNVCEFVYHPDLSE